MKAKAIIIPVILLVMLLTLGCGDPVFKGGAGHASVRHLEDPVALAALEEWGKELAGMEKSFEGEMLYISVKNPLVVISPGTAPKLEQAGFGQSAFDGGYSTQYAMTTPLDKCVWLSTLVSYPLRQKLSITPGILVQEAYPQASFAAVGAAQYPRGPQRKPVVDAIVTDSVENWQTLTLEVPEFNYGPYGQVSYPGQLFLELTIEPPGGDAWLKGMDTSFKATETYRFHLKASREEWPANIISSSIDVQASDILPFLTKVTETVATTQAFHMPTADQVDWIAMEPVTDIRAWGDFLEGYAGRMTSMSCTGPNPKSPEQIYVDRIYTKLRKADPGNSVCLLRGSSHEFAGATDGFKFLKKALKSKPYLPDVYRQLLKPQHNYRTNKQEVADIPTTLRLAIESRPDIAEFHMIYAGVLLGENKYDEAVEEYNTAQRIQPGYHLEKWQRINPRNVKDLSKAVRADLIHFGEIVYADYPDDISTRNYLAKLYQQELYFDQALAIFANTKDTQVGWDIARDYTKRGMVTEAIMVYEDLVEIKPDYVSYWIDLAKLYRRSKDTENERWAHEQFLSYVDRTYNSYQDEINESNARLAALSGDKGGHILNLLGNYPSNTFADPVYMDLAEAIGEEGYYRDALYLISQVTGDLSFHGQRMSDSDIARSKRAHKLWERFVPLFWPEFQPEKATTDWQTYGEHFKAAEGMKRTDGIRVAADEYRRLLDDYPNSRFAKDYVQLIKQINREDWERIIEGELVVAIINGAAEGRAVGSSLRDFASGRYDIRLEEKLRAAYGG